MSVVHVTIVGDTAPPLRGTLVDAPGTIAPLAGATAVVRWAQKGATSGAVGAAVIEDETGKVLRRDWAPGDLTAGEWEFRFIVTYASGRVVSYPNGQPGRIIARAQIPGP